MSRITIYHNPRCGTCATPWRCCANAASSPRSSNTCTRRPAARPCWPLVAATGEPVLALVRGGGAVHRTGPGRAWRDRRAAHRRHAGAPHPDEPPRRRGPAGTRLCRPAEQVLEILPAPGLRPAPHTHQRMNEPAALGGGAAWARPRRWPGPRPTTCPHCWRRPWRGTWAFPRPLCSRPFRWRSSCRPCSAPGGRTIDRHGGRPRLSAPNLLFAASLAGMALAQGPAGLFAACADGRGHGSGLYEAAFATLVRLYGQGARAPSPASR